MKAVPAAVASLLLVLAGCLGGPDAPPEPSPTAEPQPAAEGSCEALVGAALAPSCADGLWIQLVDCVETRIAVDLLQPAFTLPPGYEGQPSPTSQAPQQLRLGLQRCAEALVDGVLPVPDLSLSLVTVLLEDTDRGQGEVHADVYVVEAIVSPGPVQDILRAYGFPVGTGTVDVGTDGGVRSAAVSGDAAYEASTPVVGDGLMATERTGHHVQGRVFVLERACEYHDHFAPVAFTATAGAMVQAMPPAGPLPGYGSQAILCQSTIEFA